MAIAKTLDILLRAPTGKLDGDLKKAASLVNGFIAGAAALFGGFTISSFADRINEGIKSIDALGNRSIRLNVDPTSLMGLERAAIFADTSIEELEKATVSLAKNINAGAKGSQRQIELFEKLGTSASLLMSMSLPDQLQAVAAGMATIENHTEKTAVAFELFGKSGRNMLQLMADDGSLLAESMAEVRKYGGIFTNKDIAGVGAANDAWDRLLLTFNGVFQRIGADLSPALRRLWINLSDAIKPGTALNDVFIAMGQIAKLTINVLSEMAGFFAFLSEASGQFGSVLIGLVISMAAYIAITKAAKAASIAFLAVQKALLIVEKGRAALNPTTAAIAVGIGGALYAFADDLNNLIDSMLTFDDATGKVNDELGEFLKLQGQAARPAKLNLGSASFGTQAAAEQLLTVRSEQQGIGQVNQSIEVGNTILRQIRDGLGGVNSIFGGNDSEVEEVTF